jgi:uncharacterized phage protein (TIGR01671 family)
MREILFRGKREDGEWVYGLPFMEWPSCEIAGIESTPLSDGLHLVIPETIGQYTGLTDKNGKKVFEGDICRACLDPEICVCVVEYDERTASFIVEVGKTEMLTFLDYMIARNSVGDKVWIEVIGNIHDNSELLEGEENGN